LRDNVTKNFLLGSKNLPAWEIIMEGLKGRKNLKLELRRKFWPTNKGRIMKGSPRISKWNKTPIPKETE